jgi:hypothetical protein
LLAAGSAVFLHEFGRMPDIRNRIGDRLAGDFGDLHASAESLLISEASFWLRSASLPTSDRRQRILPELPRASGLDRSVKREHIRRAGDFLDNTRFGRDRFHGLDGSGDGDATFLGARRARRAMLSVDCAFSAFCRIFAVISSIELDISSRDEACPVAP